MANDALATLVKVRKQACDEAQRALIDALALEDRADQACQSAERQIAIETETATDVNGSDAAVEAFAAWLPTARRKLEHLRQVLTDRQAATVQCRAELTVCRTALETVETLIAERKAARAKAVEAVYARDLDDRPKRSVSPSADDDHF